jgi:hypothetical protein
MKALCFLSRQRGLYTLRGFPSYPCTLCTASKIKTLSQDFALEDSLITYLTGELPTDAKTPPKPAPLWPKTTHFGLI